MILVCAGGYVWSVCGGKWKCEFPRVWLGGGLWFFFPPVCRLRGVAVTQYHSKYVCKLCTAEIGCGVQTTAICFLCGMVVLGVLAGVGGGCGFDDWWKLLFPTTTPPHPHPSFPLELTAERNQVLIGRWGWDVMFWGGKDYLVSAAVGGF